MTQTAPAKTLRVLLVEDAALPREIARLLLEGAGYEVDVAVNGEEAVATARRRRYDVVLMDIGLPAMDGFSASAAIRDLDGRGSTVPVLALTAQAGEMLQDRCRAAGIDDRIGKPFRPADLLRAVEDWAERGRARGRVEVWNEEAFREIADQLGRQRTEQVLAMFEAQLVQDLDAIGGSAPDRAQTQRRAHGLVSTAGMLGFDVLSSESRWAMEAGADVPTEALASRIAAAGHHALDHLRAGRQAASA